MNTKNEDTIVRQIEKNLSNNINENLFLTGRIFENNQLPMVSKSSSNGKVRANMQEAPEQTYPLVVNEDINTMPMTVSRAEYIRQAREACLHQLSNTQIYSKPYDVNDMLFNKQEQDQPTGRKAKPWRLFHETGSIEGPVREEDSMQELASFRFLIIRTVCAILLFITIFIVDKFDIKIGDFTSTRIQEYITGKDMLQSLEDIVVTWMK